MSTLENQTGNEADSSASSTPNRLVAGPAVRTLAARSDLDIVVASNDLKSAKALAAPYSNVTSAPLNASDTPALEKLVADADVVLR